MDCFSGTLNWGDVVAQIVLLNVVLDDDLIIEADVSFSMNGEGTVYTLPTTPPM